MFETLIIGAGPAGLAAARSLQARGCAFQIIDGAETVGSAWPGHYDRLHLHTVREESHLPDLPMPASWPRYVSRDQVVEYLHTYASRFGIEPRLECAAVHLEPAAGGWRTRLASGEVVESAHVVLATGTNRIPVEPDWPGRLASSIPVMHSRAYRSGATFAGRRVLVVGMGNTGAEIALDLHEHGATAVISVRSPVNLIRRDVLGMPVQRTALRMQRLPPRVAAPLGRLLQRLSVGSLERWGLGWPTVSPLIQLKTTGKTPVIDVGTLTLVKRGLIEVRPAIRAFQPASVEFVDGRVEPFDRVILATGYRPDLTSLVPTAAAALDARGFPQQLWGAGPLAGLYFLGFNPYDAGGVLRGIRLDAARIAAHIAAGPGRPAV